MMLTRKLYLRGLGCRRKIAHYREHFPFERAHPHESDFALRPWARTLFPGGFIPDHDHKFCQKLINRALSENSDLILFTPLLQTEGILCQPEILAAGNGHLTLFHLSDKSIDTRDELANPVSYAARFTKSEWRDTHRTAAFDAALLGQLFPETPLSIHYILPDRSVHTANDPASGDPRNPGMQQADFLVQRPVDDHVLPLVPETLEKMRDMVRILSGDETSPRRGLHCRFCEFRITDSNHNRSGFDYCWDIPEKREPEILWLSHVAHVDDVSGGVITRLIRSNYRHFTDLPRDELKENLDLKHHLQIDGSTEWISPEFPKESQKVRYPLHFVDFEIARTALPLHRGMVPYDRILFEWSCHRVDYPGASPVHSLWLNTERAVPNRLFAETLMRDLGETGSIMTWSQFENSQIRYLEDQLESDPSAADLVQKLRTFHNRSLDMEEWTRRFYHHPEARGRTSLKTVLSAVLSESLPNEGKEWLKELGLYQPNNRGGAHNPYELQQGQQSVKGGTGAVSAYLNMLYGSGQDDPDLCEQLAQALKEYCRLDTLALVLIWHHWQRLTENLALP